MKEEEESSTKQVWTRWKRMRWESDEMADENGTGKGWKRMQRDWRPGGFPTCLIAERDSVAARREIGRDQTTREMLEMRGKK